MTKQVFISYAHEDTDYQQELIKHLSTLIRQKLIETWWDRQIVPGQSWAKEINNNLDKSELIIFLISSDFLASDYSQDIEVKRAMELHAEGKTTLVPVILRNCDWENTAFGQFQALPLHGKPIKNWDDKDEAYFNIVKGIRNILSKNKSDIINKEENSHPIPDYKSDSNEIDPFEQMKSNINTNQTSSSNLDFQHNPQNIFGRWRLTQVMQNNFIQPMTVEEYVTFDKKFNFYLVQNGLQTNYGNFSYNHNMLSVNLANGVLDTRVFMCYKNQLLLYQSMYNSYTFYIRS